MILIFKNSFINFKNSLYYLFIEKIIFKFKIKTFEMKVNPKITIYTPTKNRSKILLGRAVKGVLGQTYKNFEYLVIGDYCTDTTAKDIKKIKDPRIKYFELRDEGIKYDKLNDLKKVWCRGGSIPSNFALKKADGDWIARCDDDEEWKPSFLEKSLKFACEHNLEFVSSGSIYSKKLDKTRLKKTKPIKLYSNYFNNLKFKKSNENPSVGAPSTWLMRSYLKFFRFNENCWRKKWNKVCDLDFLYRLAFCNVKCGYMNKKLVYQLPRPGNNATGSMGAINDYKKIV